MSRFEEQEEFFINTAAEFSGWPSDWITSPVTKRQERQHLCWNSSRQEVTAPPKNLKTFSSSLQLAGIADTSAVEVPGCWVVLPHGCHLLKAFFERIEASFGSVGLERYDYPMIAPLKNFDAASKVLSLKDQVLYAGTTSDFANNRPRAGLCPTGEEVIYEHWRKTIRTAADLPIEMYRQARFYRPHTSSRSAGVFRSVENADVFEFHGCFSSLKIAKERMRSYFEMLLSLSQATYIPTFFGFRPLWTNQHKVSSLTIAGDTPLPIAGTIQTFCLYLQGQSFSNALPISFREAGKTFFTEHVTGAVSRRLMLAHLMIGWKDDNSFFIHPDFCPVSCKLLFVSHHSNDFLDVAPLKDLLLRRGIKADIECIEDRYRVRAALSKSRAASIPLIVCIHGKRHHDDQYKVVFERSSDNFEAASFYGDLHNGLLETIEAELENISIQYEKRAIAFLQNQVVKCCDLDEALSVASDNRVALLPLSMSKNAVLSLEQMGKGEVNSFIPSQNGRTACLITGNSTSYNACFSKRI